MLAQQYLALQPIHVVTHHDCVLREPGQFVIFDFQLLLQQLHLLLQHWNGEQGCRRTSTEHVPVESIAGLGVKRPR